MTRWERTDGGLRVTDRGRGTVPVGAPDWRPERAAGAIAVGTATELTFPRAPATLDPEGADAPARTGGGAGALTVETVPRTVVRFEGPASVEVGERVVLSFPERRRVSVAVETEAADPGEVVSPLTAEGVAAALVAAGTTPMTTGPARSDPGERPHPPRFVFEEGAPLPDTAPASALDLRVPDLESLFLAAPLAYYTGADVTVTGGEPVLSGPGFECPLGEGGSDAPAAFKRVFRADCLLREGDERAPDVDPDAPMDVRVERLLARGVERGTERAPDWSLAAYVEPNPERAALLPHLLARGATIHRPETAPLSGKALMERSLDSFYRSVPTPEPVDVCEPTLSEGELHCWHAPETPVDVYGGRLAAYENRLERPPSEHPLRVTVVCNEDRMRTEGDGAARAYDRRGLDVTHRRNLTRAELAAVLRADTDLVHFVGHCEPGGLRCSDGTLAAAEAGEVGARVFLLNACGSYHEGVDLVEAGAVAGGVTYRRVLDEQAAKVGTTFASLLAAGFSVERGLDLARRRVMMGKDYAVVGDGTHAVVRPAASPLVATVERDGGAFRVAVDAARDGTAGGRYLPPFDDAEPRLRGDTAVRTLSRSELRSLCERRPMPVVFEGEYRRATALAAELRR